MWFKMKPNWPDLVDVTPCMLSHVLRVSCLLFICNPDLSSNGLVGFGFNPCSILEFCMEFEAEGGSLSYCSSETFHFNWNKVFI